MPSSPDVSDPAYVRARAMVTLFERLEHLCEGAIAIDRGGRVIYVNENIWRRWASSRPPKRSAGRSRRSSRTA